MRATTALGDEASVRTLISHEWVAPHGGSENVFEQLASALPASKLQCLWNDAPDRFDGSMSETWLARTPLRRSKAAALPFMSQAWRSVDLESFDRVVASSHAFGHQLATRAARSGAAAFAYVHTPARYVWDPDMDERGQGRLARGVAAALKHQDRSHTSERVSYAANSEFVRDRVRRAWGRDATVIYPPVAVKSIQSRDDWSDMVSEAERLMLDALPDTFVLGASRLIEYKRLDLTIRAGEILGLPVVIAGAGPLEAELRRDAAEASVPVHLTGRVSDAMLYSLYQRTALFVFMAVEDFGIMPVEAMAAGAPVLVNDIGGASESVSLLRGGACVATDADRTTFRAAAEAAMSVDQTAVRREARRLDESAFRARVRDWVGCPR